MTGHDVIVIGSSAGGLHALSILAESFAADLPAAIFIVMHTSAENGGLLPQILSKRGPLPAEHARDKQTIRHGRIYVARPDHHLLLDPGYMRVTRGPRENRFRPAVDPLFRSAANAYGRRVVGVVLSGGMDDGTEGLVLIKRHGGIAIAQHPEDALVPGMPMSAIKHVDLDYILPAAEIAAVLDRLAREPLGEDRDDRKDKASMRTNVRESVQALAMMPGSKRVASLAEIPDLDADAIKDLDGAPSGFTCPECGGALWERQDGDIHRFRCHVGHGFTEASLAAEQGERLEAALWTALRSLKERAVLQHQMAGRAKEVSLDALAQTYEEQATSAERHAVTIHELLTGNGPSALTRQAVSTPQAGKRSSKNNGSGKKKVRRV